MLKFLVFFCSFFLLRETFGNLILIGNNVTLSFKDTEANFAPLVKGSGKCGRLYVAEPLDACSSLTNNVALKWNDSISPFVLIIRGGCHFEEKVWRAQNAGFRAAIVYDNADGDLVAMAGHSSRIEILAVFISKVAGETLEKYAGTSETELWIIPNFINSAWSIMGISFVSLLAMCAVLVFCFFVRRHRVRRRERPLIPRLREFQGMSSRLVKSMPCITFTATVDDNCTSRACAVCLEDYIVGEKIRILPCFHKFHAVCVDTWLTSWRTFCPICKRDARSSSSCPPSSEFTPLLSNSVSSLLLPSSRSSMASASPATQLGPSDSHTSVDFHRNSIPLYNRSLCPQPLRQTTIDF